MSNKLYVGNLPFSFTDDDLRNLFAAFGPVRNVEVVIDRMTNRSRGFGFVEMETADAVQQVLQSLHDTELQGRRLTVNEARERTVVGPRPGGSAGAPRAHGGESGGEFGREFGGQFGGQFGGPRHAGAPSGAGPSGERDFGAREAGGRERGYGPPRGRHPRGGQPRGGQPRGGSARGGGRPSREGGDRWSDGGGRRRRPDNDFGDE